jgi:hypothetical protein
VTDRLGDWEGPLTECQAAAADYQLRLDWPCGALGHEVWLQLPAGMAALSVPVPLARRAYERLARPGPVVARPGEQSHWVFLIQAASPAEDAVLDALTWRDAIYLPSRHLVDLPPTQTPLDGPLTWVNTPIRDGTLPTFTKLAETVLHT